MANLTSSTSPYAVAHPSSKHGINIVLITPPPFLASMFDTGFVATRTMETTKQYVDAVKDVGLEFQEKVKQEGGDRVRIAVVDMWTLMLEAAGGEGEGLRPFLT